MSVIVCCFLIYNRYYLIKLIITIIKKKVKLFGIILNKIVLIIQREIKKATGSRFDIRLLSLTIRTNAVDG
ncbi:hypothetical protein DAT299_02680 [Streptococcus suis]|nr:hypothetical protein DAT299_02680 [Streptococcus suis]